MTTAKNRAYYRASWGWRGGGPFMIPAVVAVVLPASSLALCDCPIPRVLPPPPISSGSFEVRLPPRRAPTLGSSSSTRVYVRPMARAWRVIVAAISSIVRVRPPRAVSLAADPHGPVPPQAITLNGRVRPLHNITLMRAFTRVRAFTLTFSVSSGARACAFKALSLAAPVFLACATICCVVCRAVVAPVFWLWRRQGLHLSWARGGLADSALGQGGGNFHCK